MSDQTSNGSGLSGLTANIATNIATLFSPTVLAALRNVLSGIGVLMGMLGLGATLSQETIQKIIEVVQQVGLVVGAIIALAGTVTPLIMGAIAAWKATQAQQVKRVSEIAQDPTQAQSAPAQAALVQATAAIAQNNILPKSEEAKQTLISATIALPEVRTIVADKETADAIPSSDVVASDSVKVISNDSGLDTQRGRQ